MVNRYFSEEQGNTCKYVTIVPTAKCSVAINFIFWIFLNKGNTLECVTWMFNYKQIAELVLTRLSLVNVIPR